MNQKILKTLDYAKIKSQIQEYLTTEMGLNQLTHLKPSANQSQVQQWLDETKDGADLLRLKGGIPIGKLMNIKPHLKRLKIGATLNGQELANIKRVLHTTFEVSQFFKEIKDQEVKLQTLGDKANSLELLPALRKLLNASLEDDGYVKDDASIELNQLRRRINATESQIREKLGGLTRGAVAKYLSDAIVTIRNDRYVLPVKQEYRSKFGGVVHDQSASGQTLFIEPKVIVELNNRLKREQMAEKEEVHKILAQLSASLSPYLYELQKDCNILGDFDFINAKALYAHKLSATEPKISTENHLYFRNAWHPLLNADQAVKNTITLGEDYKTIIITGPNTGGKTITLKTLGLLQLMGQSGLFIPAFEGSRIGIFHDIFADIGDEQSIEQNLSTFSAHMTNIISILDHIDESSLVLFDELGAGTDPQEGAALAISILDAVGAKGSYVVATTHYPELKTYAYDRLETINASMEFDITTLQPTYKLLLGIPGKSNALDISLRLGLDSTIVAAARSLTSKESRLLDQVIEDLVAKRQEAEEKALSLEKELADATALHDDLTKEYQKFLNERDHRLEKAKTTANEIVHEAEKEVKEIITDLRKLRLEGNSNVSEPELIAAQTNLSALEHDLKLQKNKVLQRAKRHKAFKPNDDVLVKSYGQQGVLLQKVNSHEWEVQIGILKMKIDEADLEKVQNNGAAAPAIRSSVKRTKSKGVSARLDLRGQRYEEALANVDQYLDEAMLAGYHQVTIVHGKGTGALRQGIVKYLQNHRSVKKFGFAPQNSGGNGATIVEFL